MLTRARPSTATLTLLLTANLAVIAPTVATSGPPRIDRPLDYLDSLLARPYDGGTPLRTTGPSLWTAHPIGWGFATSVSYVHHNDMAALELDLKWNSKPVVLGPQVSLPSHLVGWGLPTGDLALNPSRIDYPAISTDTGNPWLAIDGDRRTDLVWHDTPVDGEAALELAWGGPTTLGSVVVTLVVDAKRALVAPRAVRIEWRSPTGWQPVVETVRRPTVPKDGANLVVFAPVTTSELRVVLASTDHIAVAEFEAYAPGDPPLAVVERKFVSDDDVLVVVLQATNLGDAPRRLIVQATSPLARKLDAASALTGSETLSGIPTRLRVEMTAARGDGETLRSDILLRSGESTTIIVAMAFARTETDARARAGEWLATPDPVAASVRATGSWFVDNVPQLDLPDPWFEKAYAYRWQVVRRNLTDPKFGNLQHPTFTEGRWSARWFPQPITYGVPQQLREVRWLRDSNYANGHIATFVENQRADGAFQGVTATGTAREYTDWIASAIWDVYRVTGDRSLIERSVGAMRRNLDYVLSRDADGDRLPVVVDHYETGMEWQPAFFYFSGYDPMVSTPLERVDYAAALYANAMATVRASRVLVDIPGALAANAIAQSVRQSVIDKMWDDETQFYYSLRAADDAKAMVKEIVGFYPFAFELAPANHQAALSALVDPAEFWTPWPPATSTRKSPATSMDGWPIGTGGGSAAMWNGPTWPHAITLVADAMANAIRGAGATRVTRQQLFHMLARYTLAHYCCANEDRDFTRPLVGEYYHGDRGYWKTNEIDYFHSTYADILITLLVGLQPTDAPVIRVDPLIPAGTWDHFLLDGVRYRGYSVTVVWDTPGGDDQYGDGRAGLDLYVDGRLAASRSDLGKLEVPFPPARPTKQ